jgi:hypothetical protein
VLGGAGVGQLPEDHEAAGEVGVAAVVGGESYACSNTTASVPARSGGPKANLR